MGGAWKKRKRPALAEKLSVNADVEIRSMEDGFLGSWHPATIIARETNWCLVKYNELLCDDEVDHLTEYVDFSSSIGGIGPSLESSSEYRGTIRPTPPEVCICTPLEYSTCVDVHYNDAWWEGVVFDPRALCGKWKIFFPDLGDEMDVSTSSIRLTQDWNEATGEWSLRGQWEFLEVMGKLQPGHISPISIKQIWYDLKESQKCHRVEEWTFKGKAVWKKLIIEVLNDNLRITSGEVLSTVNLSQDLVVHDKSIPSLVQTRNSELNSQSSDATEAGIEVLEGSEFSHEGGGSMGLVVFQGANVHSSSTQEKSSLSSRVSKFRKPLKTELVPGDQECSSCVSEYLKTKQKKDDKVAMMVRWHLECLGWKIDSYKSGQSQRMRYTSPDGKLYYSLVKVCEDLMEIECGRSSPRAKGINEGATCFLSSDTVKSSTRDPPEYIEPVYCPEAIIEYLQSSDVCVGKDKREACRALANKARQHLLAVGWTFWSKLKQTLEWRYDSPEKKTYYSLRRACKAFLAGQSAHDIIPSSSKLVESASGGKHLTNGSDIQRNQVPLLQPPVQSMQQECKSPVNRALLKRKRRPLLHDLQDEEDEFGNGLMDIEKSNRPRKPSVDILKKKRKISRLIRKAAGSSSGNRSTQVLTSSKRAREMTSSSMFSHNPRTILSWLIDNNIVLPRAKVYYCGRHKRKMAKGRITRGGIKCGCCQNVFTLAKFEAHARSKYHKPAANIFLEDGRSLVKCQMQMLHKIKRSFPKEIDENERNENDYICSVCHYGGDLVLCDGCPASFHANCLNLKVVPDGDWFCPSCCCGLCGRYRPDDCTEHLVEKSTRRCDQCDRRFHVSCSDRTGVHLHAHQGSTWFCCRNCSNIYIGLEHLQSKPISLGHDDLTWTLIKPVEYTSCDNIDESYTMIMAENHSKLSLALELMRECFEPVKEPRTRRDLVEDVIFSRGSELKRLNFTGFYTVLLEKNDELISVATIRIFGGKVAEVPLVGTQFRYRRLGMCRFLITELEKRLTKLGVERLVLPAVPGVLNTWTGSFGFSEMTPHERSELLAYTFLDFQDTVMCHKLLKKPTQPPPNIPKNFCLDFGRNIEERQSTMELECKSAISDVYQEPQTEGGGDSQDQGQPEYVLPLSCSAAEDNDNQGRRNPSWDEKVVPCKQQDSSTMEGDAKSAEIRVWPVADWKACKYKGEVKQYSRRKAMGIRHVSGASNPNVEVRCR